MNENRPLIKRRFPGLNLSEFAKKAGELWHDMGDKSVSLLYLFQICHIYTPSLDTQSCVKRPLCSKVKFENLRSPKKNNFDPKNNSIFF